MIRATAIQNDNVVSLGLSDIALNVHTWILIWSRTAAKEEKKTLTRHVIIETLPSTLKWRQIQVKQQRRRRRRTSKQTD